jgi:putative NIF3 family GTP cyclohydrolase 1 type 2
MNAQKLYDQLEQDFITPELSDDWASHMGSVAEFITDNFKERSMGLVCDFTGEINKVYTAVFPSDDVLKKIIDDGTENAMLFVHHPAIWDIRQAPEIFQQMNIEFLKKLRDRRISIYNLHVPLDNFGQYSTTYTLAKAIGVTPEKLFVPYFGAMAGLYGKTHCSTVEELQEVFERAVGHRVSLYKYGTDQIQNNTVAIIAGGGMGEDAQDIVASGVNVLVTGITARNDHSEASHKFAEENGISLLGGTHYSTEKFACIAMTEYFGKLGLQSEFIDDVPVMEDI